MTTIQKREQLLNELCDNGNLEDYRFTLKVILNEIHDSGCRICCVYNTTRSNIEKHSNETSYMIRISLLGDKQPLSIIWTILHEFGHFKSGPPNKACLIEREIMAWDIAEQDLEKYPELVAKKTDFIIQRELGLQSYRNSEKLKPL